MTEWTDSAAQCLNDYLLKVAQTLDDQDLDSDEVLDDLRQHIEREIEQLKLEVATVDDVEKVINRVGIPVLEPVAPSKASESRRSKFRD